MSKSNRPGTPILNQNRINKTGTTTISSITNEDIMAAILSVQTFQTEQFDELRNSIKSLTSDIIALKSENSVLRSELVSLKAKVGDLESNTTKHRYENTVVQMKSNERSRCNHNILVFGITESTVDNGVQRALDDKVNLTNLLSNLSLQLSSNVKLIRLGSNSAKKPRPLKVCFHSKKEVDDLLSSYVNALHNGFQIPINFRLSKDRTSLECDILRAAYTELNQRREAGELNIKVSFINGVPSVVKFNPKNRVRPNNINQHPTI
ncbi:Uncharacterized protein FWK35_00013596 [Aphis craccivora]|uniref:Uncharacterized protein n=1 Tax=Aphis craccivora TaxID=307492 RepID=A0A6G0YDL8_APHCR|nr:Uncharacterized protein FWK35_00013596 [Aphis craccivora]